MSSEVVHHVTLGAEAFAAVLRAVERALIIVQPHVDHQVVSVVEALFAIRFTADKLGLREMVSHVRLQILSGAEQLPTVFKGAFEDLLTLMSRGGSAKGSPKPLIWLVFVVRVL